jgi:hypothetical protein
MGLNLRGTKMDNKKTKKEPKKRVKKIIEKIDGLSADDIKKIRAAIRQVWSWSYPRRLVVQRCLIAEGFSKCELCKKKCPKIFVDHLNPVGDVDSGFIERLFISSENLQGLCKKCHDQKTKDERKQKRKKGDFY